MAAESSSIANLAACPSTTDACFQPAESRAQRLPAIRTALACRSSNNRRDGAHDNRRREYFRHMMEMRQGSSQGDDLSRARQRIAQLERENAALRQRIGGGSGAPAGPRAERVLNALRDQTLQHQAEATQRIQQSFEQMQRRLQELEQSQSPERLAC